MQMVNLEILTDHGKVKNLSGKERGIAARDQLHIDQLDASPDAIEVVVPEYVDTISPSFFQGLFSKSISSLKGRDGFLAKYKFVASAQAQQWIELGIRNATINRKPLL